MGGSVDVPIFEKQDSSLNEDAFEIPNSYDNEINLDTVDYSTVEYVHLEPLSLATHEPHPPPDSWSPLCKSTE